MPLPRRSGGGYLRVRGRLANYELIEGVPGLPTAIGWRHGVVRRHLRCGDRHQRFWWQDVLRG